MNYIYTLSGFIISLFQVIYSSIFEEVPSSTIIFYSPPNAFWIHSRPPHSFIALVRSAAPGPTELRFPPRGPMDQKNVEVRHKEGDPLQ